MAYVFYIVFYVCAHLHAHLNQFFSWMNSWIVPHHRLLDTDRAFALDTVIVIERVWVQEKTESCSLKRDPFANVIKDLKTLVFFKKNTRPISYPFYKLVYPLQCKRVPSFQARMYYTVTTLIIIFRLGGIYVRIKRSVVWSGRKRERKPTLSEVRFFISNGDRLCPYFLGVNTTNNLNWTFTCLPDTMTVITSCIFYTWPYFGEKRQDIAKILKMVRQYDFNVCTYCINMVRNILLRSTLVR